MFRALRHPSRETAVAVIAGVMLVFTGWAWGGVVLWTQWVVLCLGGLALALALGPERRGPFVHDRPSRAPWFALALGLALAATCAWQDVSGIRAERASTLMLIPDATFEPIHFAQWGQRALLVGVGGALGLLILAGLLRRTAARGRLLRFPLFWLGLLLFAWIACQALNPWGLIVQRDLVWKLVPQPYVSWLPSGVEAPFDSVEEPGGMNGWRQILIFMGPWALLCALHVAALHSRLYASIAGLAVFNGLLLALAGNLSRSEKWEQFLGYSSIESTQPPFGPFVYKNHAGAWICLCLTLCIALMFYLAKRRGDRVDRGGPHLLAVAAAGLLALGAASTLSFSATAVALLLVLMAAPVAFLSDSRLRAALSPLPALVLVALAGIIVYAGVASADAQKWRRRLHYKQLGVQRTGEDDRAPLRRVVWSMAVDASGQRQFSGWGGGSYRWISPSYMKAEPAFLDHRGSLVRRSSYAHNDWLQAIAEWGLAGWGACACVIAFLLMRARSVLVRPRAPAVALFIGLLLFAAHAWYDFLLFQPQMVMLAVLVGWLSVLENKGEPPVFLAAKPSPR